MTNSCVRAKRSPLVGASKSASEVIAAFVGASSPRALAIDIARCACRAHRVRLPKGRLVGRAVVRRDARLRRRPGGESPPVRARSCVLTKDARTVRRGPGRPLWMQEGLAPGLRPGKGHLSAVDP